MLAVDAVRAKYERLRDVMDERVTRLWVMLEGGCDVRFLQEMLGHTKLETTQIYTQVSISKLREVYMRTHPAARLGRPAERADASDGTGADAEELLTDLAEEAVEEDDPADAECASTAARARGTP